MLAVIFSLLGCDKGNHLMEQLGPVLVNTRDQNTTSHRPVSGKAETHRRGDVAVDPRCYTSTMFSCGKLWDKGVRKLLRCCQAASQASLRRQEETNRTRRSLKAFPRIFKATSVDTDPATGCTQSSPLTIKGRFVKLTPSATYTRRTALQYYEPLYKYLLLDTFLCVCVQSLRACPSAAWLHSPPSGSRATVRKRKLPADVYKIKAH